jgi:hypothetical protein
MKAYKFRGPDQIQFALDIILNGRLYCANWTDLNDPMEGIFVPRSPVDGGDDCKREVEQIIEEKKKLRVCSLSKTYNSHLLWAHYASGFSGLAIEVDLPNDCPDVKSIEYRGVFAWVRTEEAMDASLAANKILSSKYDEWKYEDEVRILKQGDEYKLREPVKRIICGHRMNPALFDGLKIICESRDIEIKRTTIMEDGIRAMSVPRLNNND